MFFFIFCALLLTNAFTADELPCEDEVYLQSVCTNYTKIVCTNLTTEADKSFAFNNCRKTCGLCNATEYYTYLYRY
ncbi:hypothetical protein GCK32_022155 [Trichostrongylus colubriformis]|uniref:ShKT domain-containing protein n=1 Tax=Trichostrongylus colubriformis TaxID=6319 RepID=A0AAN8I985_TRICO